MSEDKYRDSLFARLVLKESILPKEKVENLLKEVKLRQKKGEDVNLSEIMVERGLISPDKEKELNRFLQKEIITCPQCSAPYDAQKYAEGKEFTCKKCGAKITIQKAFSETFQTTIKFGALPDDEAAAQVPTAPSAPTPSLPGEQSAMQFHGASTIVDRGTSDSFTAPEIRPEMKGEEEDHTVLEGTPGVSAFSLNDSEKDSVKDSMPSDTVEENEAPVVPAEEIKSKPSLGKSFSKKEKKTKEVTSHSREEGEEAVMPKEARFEYYQRMNPKKVFPFSLSFTPSDSSEVVRVRTQIPGCIVTPDYQDVVLSHPEPKANFWVIPLHKQKNFPGQVQVWKDKKLSTAHLPVKIVGRGMAKFFAFLLFLLGLGCGALYLHFSTMKEIVETAVAEIPYANEALKQMSFIQNHQQAGEYLLYTIYGLAGLFFLLGLIFCLVTKPKKVSFDQGLQSDE